VLYLVLSYLCSWARSCNQGAPKTLLLQKSLQLLRHQPGGGLLCATDHGWRQAACCRCHTKCCLRLQ
jgi:hypothetical protein